MAAVSPAADKASDLLQKMTLEPKSKPHDATEVTKKSGAVQNGGEVKSGPNQPLERSATPYIQNMDLNMCYPVPYFYGGYDGSAHEWGEDYSRYMNPDGVEMSPGIYGDVYHSGYGYPPYGAYPSPGSPVPTMGHDGQLYGPQHYQYQPSYYQPTPNAPYTSNKVPKSNSELSTSAAPDQPSIPLDTSKVNTNGVANVTANGNNGSTLQKSNQQNLSLSSNGSYGRGSLPNGIPSSGYQDLRYSFDGMRSPVPWFDSPVFPDAQHRLVPDNSVSSTPHLAKSAAGRNQNLRPIPHLMGLHNTRPTPGMGPAGPGMINRMYPNNQIFNSYNTAPCFRSNFYDSRTNGRWGPVMDSKYKPRGRGNGFYGYGNENMDGLTELNRGPRANNRFKNQKVFVPTVQGPVKGQCLSNNGPLEESAVPDKEQYNQAEFPDKYADGKFFIIKSYSEDDIHKSIKYNVWASTPNGNKKLDAGYQEAQEKAGGCPVFLFFSVNTSGQFVGVAEMVGPVDFNKTVDCWQQDKWNGCFSVKWHIVKDVPNNLLKHITLENNDNKPVTNSRDTQEVKLEQGLQMLKLFKEHVSKTSILDDFIFYESRQKAMQEKRAKQQQLHKQARITDMKPTDVLEEKDKDGSNVKPRVQKPFDVVTVLKKEVIPGGLGEEKKSEENGATLPVTGDAPKGAKPTVEKCVANGVANGC
ncbi:YTH domain-containing family protein 2-like [Iris pallida]|uniref:YTH domain-containing family protein n=1 Tax=Iris pallida TaxID=29817 RepID=A0AAX6DX79_IRIPA|nr:YTH domain-containing family protein 2-like [Iris pallida]